MLSRKQFNFFCNVSREFLVNDRLTVNFINRENNTGIP